MNHRHWMAAFAAVLMTGTLPLAHAAVREPDFLNGGIGHDEAVRMHERAKDYSLQVEFSARRDHQFLADAHVKIVDSHGRTVYRNAEAGPILLARLEPGTYRVTARDAGRSETQTVTISPHHTSTLYFHWRDGGHAGAHVAMARH